MASNVTTSTAVASVVTTEDTDSRALDGALYRALDVLLASLLLLATSGVLLAVCALVWLETPGPVIFRQRRLGQHKRPFTVHKLRTMRDGADPEVHRRYVHELINGVASARSDGDRSLYKLIGDDRVTKLGRVLRRTSLDELPQLFDVVRGHMSLVGPRPVTAYEAEVYPEQFDRRFAVKPGLTGLWQVSGRNQRTYREMVALDIAWVERRCLPLYLSILVRTPWVLVSGRGVA